MAHRISTRVFLNSKELWPGLPEILLLISALPVKIQFPGNLQIFANFQILTWTKDAKEFLHKTVKFGTLTQLGCFVFGLKIGENPWSYKRFHKKWSIEKTVSSHDQKCFAQTVQDKIFGLK